MQRSRCALAHRRRDSGAPGAGARLAVGKLPLAPHRAATRRVEVRLAVRVAAQKVRLADSKSATRNFWGCEWQVFCASGRFFCATGSFSGATRSYWGASGSFKSATRASGVRLALCESHAGGATRTRRVAPRRCESHPPPLARAPPLPVGVLPTYGCELVQYVHISHRHTTHTTL